ncbi:MAG: long-chain-fatty-acid--CoA ligase [Phenylobacterium sp.]|uniref:long-chain-fatty-acid--CoA ligase n=1 Tax=Phenylobacterium sp. TaxID=1871053 RepID=UPI0025E9F2FB|nr:long-chain-fatty-acid--CoA ligase [Phenylobacterium sp.]MBI1199289.1 long-chain-fatty-acid--CoA ligase [Phenylobacterium sp.]
MQSYALTIDKLLDHAAKWSGDREVVSADAGEATGRVGYAELRARSNRMSGALQTLGMGPGDRIGTLAWNTQHHLELYYAAMGAGMVCHTLNPRLTAEQIAAMVNEAEDRVLGVAASLAGLAAQVAPLCPTLQHIVLLDQAAPPPASAGKTMWTYEALLDAHGAPAVWGGFDEETPAGLCYTSGTTGRPKGVLYTHRSNYLHTLRALQADAFALTGGDCVLVAVPMFHANGWGLPFAAPAVGAKLVLPGRHADGASLARLMRDERVTLAAGVQTVWLGVLDHLDATGGELPDLKRVTIGGSSCPDALIRRMEQRLGATVQTSWGMTELSPLGAVSSPDALPEPTRSSGRVPLGLDLKLTDADGATLPEQRGTVGHLKVKGASVVDRYFKAEADALDAEGYFDTGDLASLDDRGELTIRGRSKDLIKSGGEWINPAEMEEILGQDPAVAQVAVIGRADAKWGERPVLVVEFQSGRAADPQALLRRLRGKVPDWWLPAQYVALEAMPLAATGKIDKLRLRADYAEGKIRADDLTP